VTHSPSATPDLPRAARTDNKKQKSKTRETTMPLPRSYRSIEEFEREELRQHNKAGFSLDDLMQETMLHQSDLLFDDQRDEYEREED
jgi:hypothetical protein